MPRKKPTTPAGSVDDESRRDTLLRRSITWGTPPDQSGWPTPPSFWTEEHADDIRRNHGLKPDTHLIPIFEHGATLDEKYRGLDVLVVGSPCEPDSVDVLMDIGVPRFTWTPPTPPHERHTLAIWLIRVELAGTALRLERRVSLRGDFMYGETVVTDLGQIHTAREYAELRRGLDLLDGVLGLMGKGGRPPGRTKGPPWSRPQCLDWWQSWTGLDGKPTQTKLAVDMSLSKKNPEGAVRRWRSTGLHWPPTDEELEELLEEEDE